jgi:hypothetical protein
MRTVAPEIKTVEQPVQFLNRQHDGFVGGIGRGFETLGLQALEPKAEAVALPIEDFTRLRGRFRKTKSTGSNTATLISSSTRAARPSMDFRKSTGLGYRYTFSTLASGRIMTDWLQKEIRSTASDIRFRLGMWASWSAYKGLR